MAKKTRPRAERRLQERMQRALVREREKLALLAPGGSAENPIRVPTTAVIAIRVDSLPCPQCEGKLLIKSEAAGRHRGEEILHTTNVACVRCGAKRTIFFAVEERVLN